MNRQNEVDFHRKGIMSMATSLLGSGNFESAETLLRAALVMIDDSKALNDPDIGQIMMELAAIHLMREEYPNAASLYELAVLVYSRALGSSHRNVGLCLKELAKVMWKLGRFSESLNMGQRAEAIIDGKTCAIGLYTGKTSLVPFEANHRVHALAPYLNKSTALMPLTKIS